jgi:hypothetical protein
MYKPQRGSRATSTLRKTFSWVCRYCAARPIMQPNARGEPPPEAGAQRTLEAVGSSAWFGVELGTKRALPGLLH